MPCRKENYIFLEQSVTVGSKEVDALVTKIGEALQLHNNSTAQQTISLLHSQSSSSNSSSGGGGGGGGSSSSSSSSSGNPAISQRKPGYCMRLRSGRKATRPSPYNIPGSNEQEWDHFAAWKRKGLDGSGSQDDPHQLLQELILSGNLIKEAVRRLQFSSESHREFSKKSTELVSHHQPTDTPGNIVVD